MSGASLYDKFPFVAVGSDDEECACGWPSIWRRVSASWLDAGVLCVECYPGVFEDDLATSLRTAFPEASLFSTRDCFLPSRTIENLLARELTSDRVFGRITSFRICDLVEADGVACLQAEIERLQHTGRVIVVGTGATVVVPAPTVLVYADLARWEIQRRQRRGQISSLGMEDAGSSPAALYKRAFFVDWRIADLIKRPLLPVLDFLLDTNTPDSPKLISGDAFRQGLARTVKQPFRVVPFFDPGPWGGQWMRRVCDLPDGPPNYAWCFDCVPEENSLLLAFGHHRVEIPSQDLVYAHPEALLGSAVHGRFGSEFPIRFDFLDTMQGGNLSLQVHPLTEYIQEHFGMHYTQDESYYLLDAEPDASVYLGFHNDIKPSSFIAALQAAQTGAEPLDVESFVNCFPARKHDHFLIPAGTIHCSGRNSMVLEISATPYIFTFKLWDWGRLGLDGNPRPIHLEHGVANLRWDRDTTWVQQHLIARAEPTAAGEGWSEERTGLHAREFIETRRHWFTAAVPHNTNNGVNVLNLVEGDHVMVESPTGAFSPVAIHYAETFIVPACVGPYTVRPAGDSPLYATIKAFVRTGP